MRIHPFFSIFNYFGYFKCCVKKEDILIADLTKRTKQGDQKAFELIFKLYHAPLCNYAKIYVKHPDIANEIVQDTFIRIWESKSGLDAEQSLKSYLYRSVHNNCINFIRKKQLNKKLTEEYMSEVLQRIEMLDRDFNESRFDQLITDELELTIQKSIDKLPEQCREIFLLSRYSDLTYQQIAKKLSISVNTVKTQISRSLQKIRENLKKN